jgi:hypothetical protein
MVGMMPDRRGDGREIGRATRLSGDTPVVTREGRPERAAGAVTSAAEFDAYVRRAEADAEVVGLVLMGSRGFDALVGDDSDYDLLVIVDGPLESWATEHGSSVEAWPMTLERFAAQGLPGSPDAWNRPAFLGIRVVLDRTRGEIGRLVDRKRVLGPDEASAIAAESLDGYVNSLYRSLRNLEAGRDLEGRLDALESIGPMLTTVFAFEGRVRPFNKWLGVELARQPLAFGDLAALADALASTPTAATQRAVFRRIEATARLAGHAAVIDGWRPDVDWLRGGPP